MRFLIFILALLSFLQAQIIDPYLQHSMQMPLAKAQFKTYHLLVHGSNRIDDALYKAGFEVQSDFGDYATVIVPQDRLQELFNLPGIDRISMGVKSKLMNSLAVRYQNVQRAYEKGYTGTNVIAGIIDTGIDFHHPMFIKNGKTRILSIWDQTIDGTHPSGYDYGTEFTEAQINQDLASGNPFSVVNHHDTEGHGTHVAGSFVGRDPTTTPPDTLDGGAIDANIVVVKTSYKNADILDAVNYIFGKADAAGKPCVINISLGNQYGPHDGTDDFNTSLSSLTGPGHIIVRSAGNDGAHALHYFKDNVVSSEDIQFGYCKYFTLWIEKGDNLLSVSLKWSNGSITNVTQNGHKSASGIDLYLMPASYHPNGKVGVYVFMDNTSLKNETFTLTLTGLSDNNHNSKIERHGWADSSVVKAPYGAFSQGTLYGNSFYPFTLANDACNANVIAVGSFITRETWPASDGNYYHYPNSGDVGGISSYSSIGPTANNMSKPDVVAGGTIVLSARSQDASYQAAFLPPAPYTDHYAYMQGTSMASPVAAGAIALLLEKNPTWGPDDVINYLSHHAQGTHRPAGETADQLAVKDNPNTYDRVFGYGAVDLTDAFNADSIEPIELQPTNYVLYQNRPNPFNPSTEIWFKVNGNKRRHVTLKVYNTRGQLVRTLLDQKVIGKHHVYFNGADLASGLYIYQLSVDGHRISKKMVLMK